MGNGLTAVFQIESGVGENAGATNTIGASTYGWANRDTMIALAGGFGIVAAGNLTGPARALGASLDPNTGDTGIGSNAALIGKFGGGSGAGYFDNRFSNALAYISPSMGGATVVLAYVPNENRSATTAAGVTAVDTSGYTAGVTYAGGPVTVGGAWTLVKDKGNGLTLNTNSTVGAAPIEKATNIRVGGKFDFGMGTVGLLYDNNKATVHGAGDVKQTVIYVPVTFTVGQGKIIGQYGVAGKLTNPLGADGNDFKAQHVMVGYEHTLSKRTIVKALYSQVTNKNLASYDFLYGVSAPNTTGTGLGASAGADPKGFSVGLRHSF
jgi:predicted porin